MSHAAIHTFGAEAASLDDGRGGLRLALAGGGTGGHLVPGLHLLDGIAGRPGALVDLLWLHGARPIEERVLAGLGAQAFGVPMERVRLALEAAGGGAPHLAAVCARLPRAVLSARRALLRHRSEVVLGLGGFVSVPVVLAAKSLGIPATVLEINAVPGRATRALAPLCARVFHAWRGSLPPRPAARDRLVGPPLSRAFTSGVGRGIRSEDRESARRALGFESERALLVVLGGSQGAGALNAFVRGVLDVLLGAGLSVLHQVGPGRLDEAATERAGYRAVEYIDDVARALRAAELALCRGGASTLAEIAALEVPVCVVPYPHHADRHQERNAHELADGAVVIEERALGPAALERIVVLASEAGQAERERMRAALQGRIPRDSAQRIFGELEELASTLRWKRRSGFREMAP